MDEKTKEEIMQRLASFLRYKVQDNIIMELTKPQIKEVKSFMLGLKKEIKECKGDIISIDNITQPKCLKVIKEIGDTPLFIIIDNLPKKKKIDYLFYFLSRLGEYTPEILPKPNISLIILLDDKSEFYGNISDATMSSLLPMGIEYSQKTGEKN